MPDGRRVQGELPARLHEGAVGAHGLLHQHGFGEVAVEPREMGGLAELLHEPVQNRRGQPRIARTLHGRVEERLQPGPGHVALGPGGTAQQIEIDESADEAVRRSRLQAQFPGDVREGQARPGVRDRLEHPDIPAQRLVVAGGHHLRGPVSAEASRRFSAVTTRSGVIGISKTRTPMASATALAMAGATAVMAGSPMPLAP